MASQELIVVGTSKSFNSIELLFILVLLIVVNFLLLHHNPMDIDWKVFHLIKWERRGHNVFFPFW
jgi:hypothetical protein